MGNPQVKLDDTDLDNGTDRRIVGNPVFLSDSAGKVREFHCEFLILGTDAATRRANFQAAFDSMALLNPRLRVWMDDAVVLPTEDWYTGDGKHIETVSTVTMLPEESQTQGKLHCLFSYVALTQLDLSSGAPLATTTTLEGQSSKIEIAKLYMDSERFTISAQGSFKSTLNEGVEGPYNLDGVSNNSGKARFTLESPDVVVAAFEEGMFIDVSAPSIYKGRHFLTAISGGGAILDTNTEYDTAEGNVSATLLTGDTTTAEANFAGARSIILEELLGTGDDGEANDNFPYLEKKGETITYSSERRDMLDFVLVAGPKSEEFNLLTTTSAKADRNLNYTIRYLSPEQQNTGHAGLVWNILIEGTVAILDVARVERDMHSWFSELKLKLLAEVESVVSARVGGQLRERYCEVGIDYTTNDLSFKVFCYGNYAGTIGYSRQESRAQKQPRTIWRATDGTNPTQSPKGPPDGTAVIKIEWTGDAGGGPGVPTPPSEGGFTYLYDSDSVVSEDDLEDANGNRYTRKVVEFTYLRIKPVGGGSGGGSGGQQHSDPRGTKGASGLTA